MQNQPDLIELEIGAFMGPHIQRARIALVLVGILYAVVAYRAYGDFAGWHTQVQDSTRTDEFALELHRMINQAYYYMWFTGIAGVASVVLAVLAGKWTTTSMYVATGLFAAHSGATLYIYGPAMFTGFAWWLSVIVIGMGFAAVLKAEKLRRERIPAERR